MIIGELIFAGTVIIWLIDMFIGMMRIDKEGVNWYLVIGFLLSPCFAVIAWLCGF